MNKKYIKRLNNYVRETIENKLCAMVLIGIGVVSTTVMLDVTFLVFSLMVGIPLFFTNKNMIY